MRFGRSRSRFRRRAALGWALAAGLLVVAAGAAVVLVAASDSDAPTTTVVVTTRPPRPTPVDPAGISPKIDDILDQLELVSVAFNAPADLRLHESAVIQLLLSGRQPLRELKAKLTALGKREGARVRASDSMEAHLTGAGFAIESVTPAVQLVSHDAITEWRWEVEPTKSGTRRMHLALSAIIDLNGKESLYTVRVFERRFDVRVSFRERLTGFVGDNWQWLWTALLIPLVGWLLRQRRRPTPA